MKKDEWIIYPGSANIEELKKHSNHNREKLYEMIVKGNESPIVQTEAFQLLIKEIKQATKK